MKKSKKFLAFITALSISATAFAGFATTAFAENNISTENDIVEQTLDDVYLYANEETTVYERGADTAWSDADLTDWAQTGNLASPTINAEHGLYCDTNQTGAVTKTFELPDSAVVTYDVDFYTASSTGRTTNYAYVKFGDNFTVGYNSNYSLYYSVDGGTTYQPDALKSLAKTGETTNIKATINTGSNTLLSFYIDGVEVSEAANTPLGSGAYNSISMGFVRAGSVNWNTQFGLENVKITEYVDTTVYRLVTYNVDGKTFNESVVDGGNLAEIPEAVKTGYLFKGWKVDDSTDVISTEELAEMPITSNLTITAVFEEDSDYIEPLASIEFSDYPENNLAAIGADADTAADNIISVKLTGELGTDLVANPDDRVQDLNVEWELNGFRHMVSKAQAGETNTATGDVEENSYCDYYAELVEVDDTSVNFKLRNGQVNYYGQVTAKVTYNGKTMTISRPLTVLPDTPVTAGQFLPKPGYVENFDWYSDDMVGYQASISPDNKGATDVVTGDWAAYGGNLGRGLYIASDEEGNKFLKLKSTGNNSSSFAANNIGTAPTGQVIISQDVRFYNSNSSILYKSEYPTSWNDNATSVSLDFNGSGFSINGSEVFAEGATGTWYRIVIAADVTSKLCYASVYNADGSQLIGKSDVVPFSNAGSITPKFLCYRTPDNSQGELDFNNVKVYTPTINEETFKTTIENETIAIPETAEDPAVETNLTVSAQSTEDYEMIGAATWSVVGEPTGVTIKANETDSHSAVLSVANGAPAGEITVRVSLGGITKDITVNLTSSQDSIKFTQKTSSISIPLTAGNDGTYVYEAKVVDKDGTPIDGKDVTYALYDKNNVNEVTSKDMPEGISFDKETATLTVTSKAKSTILYIRAMGTNSEDEVISRSEKITIHGLAFDFGSADTESTAEGYTAIAPDTAYSDSTGYGISNGTATVGGEGTVEDADSDNLTGTFTFQAKVEPKKVYSVTINYSGNIASEYVNADLSGVQLANAEKGAVTYTIPVIDDVLDLAFVGANVSSIVIEKQPDKTAGAKPAIYVTGDSTTANNGSWAYNLARDYGAKYPELADIATFNNTGRGGKNLSTYYTGGELRDRVLSQIRPGDYVIIGSQGTNGMGSSFEEDVNYYIDACEALGAKIIISSYSPHGCVAEYANGYDSSTQTFNSYRKDNYDEIYRKVYEERTDFDGEKYDANIIGFMDIGKNADAAFNAYVDDFAANGYDSRDAAAQAIIKCFSDHNHYSVDPLAATLMIEGYNGVPGIVSELVRILNIKSCVKIVAEYDDGGALINVTSTPTLETNATAAVKEGNTLTTYWYSFESMEPVVK